MPIQIELLEGDFDRYLPSLTRIWNSPDTAEYMGWRAKAPGQIIVVARKNDQVVATVSAFSKRYRIRQEEVACLETFDWHTLPEYRGTGWGIRVLQHLMNLGRPIVVLGGSQDTLSLLPRMGWKTITHGQRFVLFLSGDHIRGHPRLNPVLKTAGGLAGDVLGRWLRLAASQRRPSGFQVQPANSIDGRIMSICRDTDHALAPIPDPEFWDWVMRGYAGVGFYVPLTFLERGCLWAWGVGRVYTERQRLVGKIVEVFAAPGARSRMAPAVRSLVAVLAGFGVSRIEAVATCPAVQAALRRNRFVPRQRIPLTIWEGISKIPEGSAHQMSTQGDQPFFPLCT